MSRLTLLTLLLFLIIHFSMSYHIKPINSSSGLLYVHLGKAKLSNQKFTLLTFVNLTHIEKRIDSTYLVYYKSLAVCNKLSTNEYTINCKNQLSYINTKLTNIQNDYAIISHQLNNYRTKRGILNGIGDGFKFLFGIPDAEDAQFYTDSINSLINNQRQTSTLMQQQVRIISSTIRNFNDSLRTLNHNTKILNDNIKKFDDFMSQTATQEQRLTIENKVNEHIISLIEMTDEIQITLTKYIDSVTLISKGIISYNVFSPKDLYLELGKINSKYTLPLELEFENTYIYYNLMDITAFVKNGLLVIALKVPLVNSLNYDLYQVHPLFTPHKNDSKLFSYIEPTKSYLLLSLTRTVYSTINNLDECNEYRPTEWLCKEISTSKRTDAPTCEMELFLKTTTSIPKTCQIKHLYADAEIWHRLSPSEWLYILSKPTSLNIICKDEDPIEETINKIGILQLERNCRAYSDHVILESQATLGTTNITTRIPVTDITDDDCCQKLQENITIKAVPLKPITLTNFDLDELKFAQHRLNQFDQVLQQQLKEPFIVKHSNWFTLLLSFILAIAALILLYNFLKWFGITKIIRNWFCFTREPHNSTSRMKSCCLALPCVNIYNQSYNNRQVETAAEGIRYNAETEQLCFQQPPAIEPARPPSKTSGRRSTRSMEINAPSLKLTTN